MMTQSRKKEREKGKEKNSKEIVWPPALYVYYKKKTKQELKFCKVWQYFFGSRDKHLGNLLA